MDVVPVGVCQCLPAHVAIWLKIVDWFWNWPLFDVFFSCAFSFGSFSFHCMLFTCNIRVLFMFFFLAVKMRWSFFFLDVKMRRSWINDGQRFWWRFQLACEEKTIKKGKRTNPKSWARTKNAAQDYEFKLQTQDTNSGYKLNLVWAQATNDLCVLFVFRMRVCSTCSFIYRNGKKNGKNMLIRLFIIHIEVSSRTQFSRMKLSIQNKNYCSLESLEMAIKMKLYSLSLPMEWTKITKETDQIDVNRRRCELIIGQYWQSVAHIDAMNVLRKPNSAHYTKRAKHARKARKKCDTETDNEWTSNEQGERRR